MRMMDVLMSGPILTFFDSLFKEKPYDFTNVELNMIFDMSPGFYQECEFFVEGFYAFPRREWIVF